MLAWHCSKFAYRPTSKAMETAEEVDKSWREFSEILVILVTVEMDDNIDVVEYAKEEIINMANEVKVNKILLYPYAHLSRELAPPDMAKELLSRLYDALKENNLETYLAPFGHYKEFKAEVKGHPIAERLRIITKDDVAEVRRKAVRKRYIIITPDGEELPPSEDLLSKLPEEFRILVEKEALSKPLGEVKHEMLEYLKRFGFEWEERSDFGHQRLAPYAALIFEIATEYSRNVIKKLGIPIYEVKGTAFFNMKDRAVKEHADLYGDRLYKISTDRGTFVLRYAACHQQFSMLSDWYITYKQMPFGIFEVADSYRYEQSGEIELSFRVRRFWMPDLHILTRSEEEAKVYLLKVHDIIIEEAKKLGETYDLLVNVVSEEEYRRYKEFIKDIAKNLGRPVLVAVYQTEGAYYWTINIEYHIVDYIGRPREIGTVQIDVGNARRFNINYIDEEEKKRFPVIIHTAILGTIERYIYMLFDSAMKMKNKGKKPMLPFWISPVQVRIIPVNENVLSYAEDVKNEIASRGYRVDIDDTNRTLSRKILDAEKEWVPYVVIIGEKEKEQRLLSVRCRAANKQSVMSLEEFIKILDMKQDNYPKKAQCFPDRLSIRIRMTS
ncbi:MAG: threonine--tRNA ligase [Candidatus Korarchaeota archaeon]|nr:threonine--tRNA ligase [Thermoproteota archaeon]MCR8463007.1 threonine--tRNA ligase [Thermoproteota archaeon]MCR8470657.1 threonine--tRNA ligase [Thermoproteota archaeon]MCR8471625.1 threonine--tRNA ligase [Thermoproteota archaeon]MCR8473394.1 threonine--tRNA ligase [Thermoproteota archaeon]